MNPGWGQRKRGGKGESSRKEIHEEKAQAQRREKSRNRKRRANPGRESTSIKKSGRGGTRNRKGGARPTTRIVGGRKDPQLENFPRKKGNHLGPPLLPGARNGTFRKGGNR